MEIWIERLTPISFQKSASPRGTGTVRTAVPLSASVSNKNFREARLKNPNLAQTEVLSFDFFGRQNLTTLALAAWDWLFRPGWP